MRSYEEAIADVAAPGQPFEVINVEREGYSLRAFKNSPSTLRQFFDLARGAEGTFLVYEDEEWSFRDVMSEVDALAHALVNHFGVKKGDRVGIAMRNYPEWMLAFMAVTSLGAIAVAMSQSASAASRPRQAVITAGETNGMSPCRLTTTSQRPSGSSSPSAAT